MAALIDESGKRFDLIHLNHEGLFLFARMLHERTTVPLTMHIRTRCFGYASRFARWQARVISGICRHLIFITENEEKAFRRHGFDATGSVLYNAVSIPDETARPMDDLAQDPRFKLASLSNFDPVRGTDRLLELAEILSRRGRSDIVFVVAGDMTMTRTATANGVVTRSFAELVAGSPAANMFRFLGHVEAPEGALLASDALIKPTREANPWGRDILEAMAASKPVLTVGSYDRFVRDGETGILMLEYDPDAMADAIEHLADNRAQTKRMGERGRTVVAELCDGDAQSTVLLDIWRRAARS